MGGRVGGVEMKEPGVRRRFVMRLKGFSSTLSSRALWRASVNVELSSLRVIRKQTHLLQLDLGERRRPLDLNSSMV